MSIPVLPLAKNFWPTQLLGDSPRTPSTPVPDGQVERAWGSAPVGVVVIRIVEAPSWADTYGVEAADAIVASVRGHIADLLWEYGVEATSVVDGFDTHLLVDDDMPLDRLSRLLTDHLGAQRAVHEVVSLGFTTAIGYSWAGPTTDVAAAREAAELAARRRDLQPVEAGVTPSGWALLRPLRNLLARSLGATVALTIVLGVVVPFCVYSDVWLTTGVNLGPWLYGLLTASVMVTATMIYVEGLRAIAPHPPIPPLTGPPPAVSVIVAAYLPNEVTTVRDTIRSLLDQDYEGELQVILAYNTPVPSPIEHALHSWARYEPRLEVVRVEGSTSKAANVNAALAVVRGEVVGVFDADHQPQPDVVTRAAHWMATGADIVQGRCAIRNGDESAVSRMVAVEFEQMYGLSHPGRARVHGFGIFGGSNGFWRTELLRRTRLRCTPLTEDIDATVRAVDAGARIVSDPAMVSWELAPVTLTALAHQRLRWTQGWTEVSVQHMRTLAGSPRLSPRARVGASLLFGWREIFPWIALQFVPIVGYQLVWQPNHQPAHLFLPLFVVFAIYAFGVNVAQGLLAWRLAVPPIRSRHRWFLRYSFFTTLWYSEWKSCIARAGHLRHLLGLAEWKVTARRQAKDPTAPAAPR